VSQIYMKLFKNQCTSFFNENFLFRMQDFELTLRFLKNSKDYAKGRSDPLTAIMYNNLAGICLQQGIFDKSFKYSEQSLLIIEPIVMKNKSTQSFLII
jgi:hypothetical protein